MMGKQPGYATAVFCSLSIHGLLLAVAIFGWTPQFKETKIRPRYIEATLLQVEAPKLPTARKAETKPQQKPVETKPVPPKPVAEKAVEQKRIDEKKQEQIKHQERLLVEQKQREEAVRRERLVKEQKQREELAKKDKEKLERLRKEEEARRRAQQEAAERDKEREDELAQALEEEQAIGTYSDYIANLIASNWSRPPSARLDMEVTLSIQMMPTGRVVSVAIVKSSGNDAFDRSAEQAVQRVARFDRLAELSRTQPRVFESQFRRFKLTFRPEDLRL